MNPIEQMIVQSDKMAVLAMRIEADAMAGLVISSEQFAVFARGIREHASGVSTLLRTVLDMINEVTETVQDATEGAE